MPDLVVRNLDPQVIDALKRRAAHHGRSAEAEHRILLAESLLTTNKKTFAEVLAEIPNVGVDSDFERAKDDVTDNVLD